MHHHPARTLLPRSTPEILGAYWSWAAVCALLGFAYWIYAVGLQGAFLFDDFANLPALGATGPVDNWPAFWRYVTSGEADPTGRPLALLSFLVDAQDWPADPLPFKRSNLLLHLLNGVLLWRLLRHLGKALQAAPEPDPNILWRVEFAAWLGMAFWLLHPLLVSTTLYVVQREAMLPATCALGGLLMWLRGRGRFATGATASGAMWMALGLVGGTLLGVLSKANGILLPVYVLLLEWLVLRPAQPLPVSMRSRYQAWLALLAALPAMSVFAYLAWEGYRGIVHGVGAHRPWTLQQRLLSEPGIVLDYLRLLWLPRPYTAGLFNDQIEAARGLWSPPGTALSILLLGALLGFAVAVRRRWPIVAAALLFFFAGQLLESTTVALELYYEHRNYVPALLLFWPLAWWLCGLHLRAPTALTATPRLPPWRIALAVVLLGGVATMTHLRADLWGNVRDQAVLWAQLNPSSPRAQANAAQIETANGQAALAEARLERALAEHPDQTQIALNLVAARCQLGGVDSQTLSAAETALRTAREGGVLLAGWFERALDQSAKGTCAGFGLQEVEKLLGAAFANPYTQQRSGRSQDLLFFKGAMALKRGDGPGALSIMIQALDAQVRASAALKFAATLGSAGFPNEGLTLLDHYETVQDQEYRPGAGMPRIHAWVLAQQRYWPNEIAHLRSVLEDDVRSASSSASNPALP
jgi:hypothetical protein